MSTDHIDGTRLVTDGNATVIAAHDYLPFGEELRGGHAGRISQWAPDGNNADHISPRPCDSPESHIPIGDPE